MTLRMLAILGLSILVSVQAKAAEDTKIEEFIKNYTKFDQFYYGKVEKTFDLNKWVQKKQKNKEEAAQRVKNIMKTAQDKGQILVLGYPKAVVPAVEMLVNDLEKQYPKETAIVTKNKRETATNLLIFMTSGVFRHHIPSLRSGKALWDKAEPLGVLKMYTWTEKPIKNEVQNLFIKGLVLAIAILGKDKVDEMLNVKYLRSIAQNASIELNETSVVKQVATFRKYFKACKKAWPGQPKNDKDKYQDENREFIQSAIKQVPSYVMSK